MRCRQRGVVLAISLVLLAAMSILGVATLSSTTLNEKIASNTQQKAIAFEVAESAIAAVWDKSYINTALASDPVAIGNDPAPITIPAADTGLISDFDLQNSGGYTVVDIEGTVTVQYCGEVTPIGSDLNANESASTFVFRLVDVNSVVQIANSNSTSDHVQRGAVTALKTNRTGNCPLR